MTQQTVHWAEELGTLRRIHLRRALRRRIDTGVGVLVLLLLALFLPDWRGWLLGGVLLVLLLVVVGIVTQQAQLGQAASASGPVTFRFHGQTLDASNRLGDFRIPQSQIKRLIRDSDGLIVDYAAGSMLTVPNGPVKDALLASFAAKEGSA